MCWSLLGTALSVAVESGVFDEYDNLTTKSRCRGVVQDPSQDQRAYSIQTSGRLGNIYPSI